MKIKDMTANQKRAYTMIRDEYNGLVGGYENVLLDYPKDSDEYQEAIEVLNDHDGLLETIYAGVIADAQGTMNAKHIKFAGTEFMKEIIRKMLEKDGY